MTSKSPSSQESVDNTLIIRLARAILQYKELAAALIIAIHLYLDWYIDLVFLAQVLTFSFILLCYWLRSELPWTRPRILWLWAVFLALALIPALRSTSLTDSIYYYGNVILNVLLVFWLGQLVVRDLASLRRLFSMLAFLGALLAIPTIIEARTGVLLFKTNLYDASLNVRLGKTGIFRAASYLRNPDSNGSFFALIGLLPLGLLVYSSSVRAKVLYLIEMALILPALLFTYSTGAWLGLCGGVLGFLIFVGRMRPRIQIVGLIVAAVLVLVIGFHHQSAVLLQHALDSDELSLRLGVWQTGLRVIRAFPWLGIGLGRYVYIVRAAPYRVSAQLIPVYHPHNSFLEIAALGGIPLALIFLVLFGDACWRSVRNWKRAAVADRALFAGGLGLVCSLTVYSLSNAGWTLTPLLAIGWLVLGGLASPWLTAVRTEEVPAPAGDMLPAAPDTALPEAEHTNGEEEASGSGASSAETDQASNEELPAEVELVLNGETSDEP